MTITSYPGERATLVGRFRVADAANFVTVAGLDLDGRNERQPAEPDVNGDDVVVPRQRRHEPPHGDLLPARQRHLRPRARRRDRAQPHPRLRRAARRRTTTTASTSRRPTTRGSSTTGSTTTPTAACRCSPTRRAPTSPRNVIDGNGQGVSFSRESAEQRRRAQRDLQLGAALEHRGLGADRRRQRRAPQLRVDHAPQGQRRHPAGPRGATVENKVTEPGSWTGPPRTSACGRTAHA